MCEEVVDSDRMNKVEFDERSICGILDKYNWYLRAMTIEYGPSCKWHRADTSKFTVAQSSSA